MADSASESRRLLRRVIPLAAGLLLTGTAFAQQTPAQVQPGATQPAVPAPPPSLRPVDESVLVVPPVVDRPLGLEEGAKIHVKRFTLAGAKDHPERKLSVAALQKLLDDALAAQPADGYTVNQLQQLASKVGVAYREHGFVLTQAFVPAQEVKNGEVVVQVLEGRLGRVRVEGRKHYSESTIASPFLGVRGQAVEQSDVEARLMRLSDYPGLTVLGVFTPGANVGESDLVLKVQREKLVEFTIGGDNYGNPFAGQNRGRAGLTLNSPLSIGDKFDFNYVRAQSGSTAAKGADTNYYATDYKIPFAAGRAAFTLGYSDNEYAAGGSLAGLISGHAKVGEAGVDIETSRSRLGSSFFFVNGERKKADFVTPLGTQNEDLKDVNVGWVLDRSDSGGRGRWVASIAALHGSNSDKGVNTIRAVSDSSYTVERLDLERIQQVTTYNTLRLKLGGQLTSNALPTLEQVSLGGPSSVRAYQVAQYVGDKSTLGTLEWYIGAPGFASKPGPGGRTWGQTLQLVLFYDYARGYLNKVLQGEQPDRDLKGWGGGIVATVPHHLSFRVDVSKPQGATATDRAQPFFKDTRIYATLAITF